MKPRYYQSDAVASIFEYFKTKDGNPVIALPTGTGKSIVIADFAKQVKTLYPDQKIMMLTHVKELIAQNYDKLIKIWPTAPAGIYSAGLRKKQHHFSITYAGIGSVCKKANLFGHVDLIIIDEAHLVSPNAATMYRKFISALLEINPYLKVIGLTATTYRTKTGTIADGNLFTDICFDLTGLKAFNRLVAEGFLSPLITKPTELKLDVSEVGERAGEYITKDLQLAVDKNDISVKAVEEMCRYGVDRSHWLVFASGIDHAIHICTILNDFGVVAKVIHSKMNPNERAQVLEEHQNGTITCLVNNDILTTGYDFPGIDLIGVLRPSKSPGLWVQMLGRGTRPVYDSGFDLETVDGRLDAIASGAKQDCLVLDFARNIERLGPINDPVIPTAKGKKKGGGVAPIKLCEECNSYIHASLTVCPHCFFEFPRQLKINTSASNEQVMVFDKPVIKDYNVTKIIYGKHSKTGTNGKINALKVTYYCGLRRFKEYVCIEYPGKARGMALKWWKERGVGEMPSSVDVALEEITLLKEPIRIKVWTNTKYPKIMECEYEPTSND